MLSQAELQEQVERGRRSVGLRSKAVALQANHGVPFAYAMHALLDQPKGCELCGDDGPLRYHRDSGPKPHLLRAWLCRSCSFFVTRNGEDKILAAARCVKRWRRESAQTHLEPERARLTQEQRASDVYRRAVSLRVNHGISIGYAMRVLAEQPSSCEICDGEHPLYYHRNPGPRPRTLRAWLCQSCVSFVTRNGEDKILAAAPHVERWQRETAAAEELRTTTAEALRKRTAKKLNNERIVRYER